MKYITTAVCSVPAGSKILLTKAQAGSRAHALDAAGKKGWYVARQALQFKTGETFEVEGDALPKSMAEAVEIDDGGKAAAEQAAADKAAADKAAAEKAAADAAAAGASSQAQLPT